MPAPGEEALICYVDGGCKSNNNCSRDTPAGWGVIVLEGDAASDLHARALLQLFGRVVVTPSSRFFLGADKGSNNTGELSAVVEALLWVNEVCVYSLPVTDLSATWCA